MQPVKRGATARSKQAEAADNVNHTFTAFMLWGLQPEVGGSFLHPSFFFLSVPITVKILSAPLVLSAELFHPGPLLY